MIGKMRFSSPNDVQEANRRCAFCGIGITCQHGFCETCQRCRDCEIEEDRDAENDG